MPDVRLGVHNGGMATDLERRRAEHRARVIVRVSEAEREQLAADLAAEGLTVSQWLRERIRERLDRGKRV